MRRVAWCLATFLALALAPPLYGGGGDEREAPDKFRTPEEERQALLNRLGEGPVYQVDILYRCREDGRLYLCQTLLSPKRKNAPGGIPAFGLDEKGKPVELPDPQTQRIRPPIEVSSKDGQPRYPPAQGTRYLGAYLEKPQGDMTIRVTDVATGAPLPKQPGEVTVTLFQSCAFRIERLPAETVQKYQPLCEDPSYFCARVESLRKELLGTHRDLLTQSPEQTAQAAVLLRESFLVDLLRKHCADWIDRPPGSKAHIPLHTLYALGLAGDATDGKLLQRWLKQRPEDSYWLARPTLDLMRRQGARDLLPLFTDLLHDTQPAGAEGNAKRLIENVKELPRPTRGDDFLRRLLQEFDRNPADFGFKSVPQRLLDERLTFSVEDRERIELAVKHPLSSDWLFFSTADRQRGVDEAIAWLKWLGEKSQ